ncbi:hypothetical protein [Solirhodobacter olei]|uniref:hypothetical protein n=1 Tax=Solirhodobacter olei TaxID=2493082 RepID=UPI0013E32DDB|nr:hypothetical protein [Solirhodobacter olei]
MDPAFRLRLGLDLLGLGVVSTGLVGMGLIGMGPRARLRGGARLGQGHLLLRPGLGPLPRLWLRLMLGPGLGLRLRPALVLGLVLMLGLVMRGMVLVMLRRGVLRRPGAIMPRLRMAVICLFRAGPPRRWLAARVVGIAARLGRGDGWNGRKLHDREGHAQGG